MKRLIAIFSFLLLLYSISTGQDVYVNIYGGLLNEEAYDMVETSDGGYLIVGSTSSSTEANSDIYLVKVDIDKEFEWSKVIGDDNVDWGESIVGTTDGNYFILGNTINGTDYDIVIYKIDEEGTILWQENYGGSNWDFGHSIINTITGNYIIGGETYSNGAGSNDAFLFQIDDNGSVMWEEYYGQENSDKCLDVFQDELGNTFFVGTTVNDLDTANAFLSRVDPSNGGLIWQTIYEENETYGYGVVSDESDVYIVGKLIDGNSHYLLAKFDYNGVFVWDMLSGNEANQEMNSICLDEDGDLVLIGTTDTFGSGGTTILLHKRSSSNAAFGGGATFGFELDDFGKKVYFNEDNDIVILAGISSATSASSDFATITIPFGTDFNSITEVVVIYNDSTISISEMFVDEISDVIYTNSAIDFSFDDKFIGGFFSLYAIDGKLISSDKLYQDSYELSTYNVKESGVYFYSIRKDAVEINGKIFIK